MSKLDELIQQLCPHGVEFVHIGEVVTYEQPTKYIVKSTQYDDSYATPVLTAGQSFVLGKTNETNGIYNASNDNPVIIFDDFTGAFKWVDFPFKVKSSAIKILRVDEKKTTLRYIFHTMGYINFSSDEHKRLWIGIYSNICIPLPPLEVQQEIARILDQFTELTAELTTKLNAELAARKKQYEYYRDALFFVENSEYILIKDLATTNIGLATSVTKHKVENGILLLHNSDIQQNRIVLKQCEYISEGFAQKNTKKLLRKDDIITVHTGDVGTSAVIDGPYIGAIGFTTITTRINDNSKIIPQYLCHYLNSRRCKADIAAMTISDRNNLNQKDFDKLVIPVPPLEEQYHIVSILDRLETFCNNLSSGLPAEIEARRKQYEYYRDKLFTFKELEV